MQGRKEQRKAAIFLTILCFFLAFFITGCSKKQDLRLLFSDDSASVYDELVSSCMPEYSMEHTKFHENLFASVRDGDILECYDIQAMTILEKKKGFYWYPQCLSTVIIAADRSKTDARPESFEELLTCGEPVSFWYQGRAGERLIMAAMFYGMEGEKFTGQKTAEFLKKLGNEKRYRSNDPDAPIFVIMDHDADQMIREGKDLEIIVPANGTFSYARGILSSRKLTSLPSDRQLLDAGLRLQDGRHRNEYLPPEEEYRKASRVQEFQRILDSTSEAKMYIKKSVLVINKFMASNSRKKDLYPLMAMIATLFWMGSALRRVLRVDLRRCFGILALQVALWMALRMVKYHMDTYTIASRYCWYGYYIFQLGLPVVMLWLTVIVDDPERKKKLPLWMKGCVAAGIFLLLLVFTNDLHQLVFRFDLSGDWASAYTYGPGYLAIYGYCFLTFLISVILMIWKSRKSPQRFGWVSPVIGACLLVGYTLSYALRVRFIWNTDYALCFCMLVVVFMESCLHTGLIPVNTRYRSFFTMSPLAMQLLNKKGNTVLASQAASVLPPVLRLQLSAKPSVTMDWDHDSQLFGRTIRGGTVVWEEDRSSLNAIRREANESNERLKAANVLLKKEGGIRKRKLEIRSGTELFNSLETEIEERTRELSEAIDDLRTASDREHQIACITLLLCYIKRRCNLFFLEKEGKDLPVSELSMYLDELCEFARYAGSSVLTRCPVSGTVPVRKATLCYDFAARILIWSSHQSQSSLLGYLDDKNNRLEFSFLTSDCVDDLEFSESFLKSVGELNGTVTKKKLDEETGIYLILPEGGIGHD